MRGAWVRIPSESPNFFMKQIFLDVETAGLDKTKHTIIQLSGLIEIDGEVVEEFDWKIKPFPGTFVSKPSLQINNISFEDLKTFPPPEEIYQKFVTLLSKYADKYCREDKFFLIGYNSKFDEEFLRNFFERNGDEYFSSWFWWPSIDVAQIAALLLKEERHKFQNFKLETLARHFGIFPEGEFHNSLSDSKVTRSLYKILLGEC